MAALRRELPDGLVDGIVARYRGVAGDLAAGEGHIQAHSLARANNVRTFKLVSRNSDSAAAEVGRPTSGKSEIGVQSRTPR